MSALYDDVQMDSQQQRIQKFWNLCGLYQDIYDWILPLNKQPGKPFYSNTAVYGEKCVWYFWSLAYFSFFWST